MWRESQHRPKRFARPPTPRRDCGDEREAGSWSIDHDGRADYAVFRSGTWWIASSSTGATTVRSFGIAGDVPGTWFVSLNPSGC